MEHAGLAWYCWSNCFRVFIETTYNITQGVNGFDLAGTDAVKSANTELLHRLRNGWVPTLSQLVYSRGEEAQRYYTADFSYLGTTLPKAKKD
jgi:hypothetical protein